MGGFTLLIGLALLFGGWSLGRGVSRIKGWPTARATVVERGVGAPEQPTGGSRNARFVPRVRYTFEVDGVPYEAHGIGPVQEAMTAEDAQAFADALPAELDIHYDPADPSRAYIETGSLSFAILLGILGGLAVLVGVGMLLSRKGGAG